MCREGFPFYLTGFGLSLIFFFLEFKILAILSLSLTCFFLFFFRDPERKRSPFPKNAVLSPADGRVVEVKELLPEDNPLGLPAIKISIFLSLFNVHINRIPTSGKILKIIYNKGRFFPAHREKTSELNEQNRITIQVNKTQKIIITQIAGFTARRISCWIREGEHVKAGQRFGLIKFGSRLELYLPTGTKITAKPKDKVKAGVTILGYLP